MQDSGACNWCCTLAMKAYGGGCTATCVGVECELRGIVRGGKTMCKGKKLRS